MEANGTMSGMRPMSEQELMELIPEFVEEEFPKQDTEGLIKTPGRGEAAVLLTKFLMHAFKE
jgi:hypothetical protein